MELKEIEDIVTKGLSGVDKKFEASKEAIIKEITEKGFQSKEEVELSVKEAIKDMEDEMVKLKKALLETKASQDPKTLHVLIGEGLKAKESSLKNLKNGGSKEESMMLVKADEDLNPANWSGSSYAIATTENRGLYQGPFSPFWLRNLLPNGTTSGGTIQYLKENGDVGAAGVWDGTGTIAALTSKPGTAPLFDSVTENVIWIAGITRVKREMLDDIAWLQGYLTRRLTVGRTGLWVAENTQIYNKLAANSTAYSGARTIPIEILYEAAFAQLRDNDYYPTAILMNQWDIVDIALNKADTSGIYNLPNGTITTVNGQVTMGGIPLIASGNVSKGDFLVIDANATEFISRMSPEVRFFEEDRDNVPKNLVTVRAEERILPIVYDDTAIISGSFTPTT